MTSSPSSSVSTRRRTPRHSASALEARLVQDASHQPSGRRVSAEGMSAATDPHRERVRLHVSRVTRSSTTVPGAGARRGRSVAAPSSGCSSAVASSSKVLGPQACAALRSSRNASTVRYNRSGWKSSRLWNVGSTSAPPVMSGAASLRAAAPACIERVRSTAMVRTLLSLADLSYPALGRRSPHDQDPELLVPGSTPRPSAARAREINL